MLLIKVFKKCFTATMLRKKRAAELAYELKPAKFRLLHSSPYLPWFSSSDLVSRFLMALTGDEKSSVPMIFLNSFHNQLDL